MEEKPKWLSVAEEELGTKEIAGPKSNPKIDAYAVCTTLKATSDEIAWCSSFVNWCMAQAGEMYTKSAAARSWLDFGLVLDTPRVGCIVILKRGNNPQSGHVGFYIGELAGGWIKVLGGNQSDQVKYSNFHASEVLGYRWPA